MIENQANGSSADRWCEVLIAVFGVRVVTGRLEILLWQRAQQPDRHRWALPGGGLRADELVDASARRQLAEKVDVSQVAHLEQTGVFSAPGRIPGRSSLATGFLALVPLDADPDVPADTRWHPLDELPAMAFDHAQIAAVAHQRLRAKLSYTNIAYGLAPAEFTIATLRDIYAAALGHDVDPTNLQRVLTRRGMLTATGRSAPPGPAGGRPASLYRFTVTAYRVTDPFAAFRPPSAGY